MATRFFVRSITALGSAGIAAALLAGCGGSQGALTPQSSSLQLPPAVKGHCSAHGGVRVMPCTVDLTVSNPGPDTVTVRTPKNKKGTVTESDNCGGASGIATVTQGTGDTWIVTAGAMTGSCTATFDFTSGKKHKVIGSASLSITNSI